MCLKNSTTENKYTQIMTILTQRPSILFLIGDTPVPVQTLSYSGFLFILFLLEVMKILLKPLAGNLRFNSWEFHRKCEYFIRPHSLRSSTSAWKSHCRYKH
ncbi:hypothetical protein FKM82_011621 [Ascaphus truei]